MASGVGVLACSPPLQSSRSLMPHHRSAARRVGSKCSAYLVSPRVPAVHNSTPTCHVHPFLCRDAAGLPRRTSRYRGFRGEPSNPAAVAPSSASPAVTPSHATNNPTAIAAARAARLFALVELRRVNRNILRAKYLIELPTPIYSPQPVEADTSDTAVEESGVDAAAQLLERSKQRELLEQERRNAALDTLAELQLTSEQLRASVRALPASFGFVFPPGTGEEAEATIRNAALDAARELQRRFNAELGCMPYSQQQIQSLIDTRNAKHSPAARQRLQDQPPLQQPQGLAPHSDAAFSDSANASGSTDGDVATSSTSPLQSLSAADRLVAAESFVDLRIKPVLRRATQGELGDVLQQTGGYLRGLWVRLNGGRLDGERSVTLELPQPIATRKESDLAMSQLSLELSSLERRLQDASKSRESRLRNAGIKGSVQMAITIKLMDADVLGLSRLLAVRSLQLEMEHTYRSLEDEALDVAAGSVAALLQREGSTTELALLIAEFVDLDEQLAVLADAVLAGDASLGEDILEKLAVDIPDMRSRVGIVDQVVYGGQGFTLTKARLQALESFTKVQDGLNFMVRGVRLLGSDCGAAGRLFVKAATGTTLKRREVSAIRRTLLDVITFVPFAIILIIPLTPLGHVLIFSFIQRYFPSLFPSQFTTKRQQIMLRYEELQAELMQAQAALETAEDEAELARAAAAVARLTAPNASTASSSSSALASSSPASLSVTDEAVNLLRSTMSVSSLASVSGDDLAGFGRDGTDGGRRLAAGGTAGVTGGTMSGEGARGGSVAGVTGQGVVTGGQSGDGENGSVAAARVRALEEQLTDLKEDVHLGEEVAEEEEAAAAAAASDKKGSKKQQQQKKRH